MKFIICCIIACISILNVDAQVNTDSLEALLPKTKADTSRIKLLADLCWELKFTDSTKSFRYGREALQLAQKLKEPKWEAQALNDLGTVYLVYNQLETSTKLYINALEIRTTLKDTMGMAALYNKIGALYQKQGAYYKSLDYQLKAAQIYEDMEHAYNLGQSYNNIGIVFKNLNQNEKALEYYEKSIRWKEIANDKQGICGTYNNMSEPLLILGDTAKAIALLLKAEAIGLEIKDKAYIPSIVSVIGEVYTSMGKYTEAERYLNRAVTLRNAANDDVGLANTIIGLATLYRLTKRYAEAQAQITLAEPIVMKYNQRLQVENFYHERYELSKALGNSSDALKWLEMSKQVHDSLLNEQTLNRIAGLQTEFETVQKEKTISRLNEEKALADLKLSKQRNWIIILFSAILAIIGLTAFYNYKKKLQFESTLQKAQIAEQQRGLEAVISATEEERKRIAKDLHDGVGQVLSGLKMSFDRISKLSVEQLPQHEKAYADISGLIDEASRDVRTISHQMMPRTLQESGLVPALEEMLRRSLGQSNLVYHFDHMGAEQRFAENIEISLYRIAQELVNNIIKHSGATELSVQLFKNLNFLILIVEDNGKGMPANAQTEKGIGLHNISSRVTTIHGEMNFEPGPESGTVATIRVPLLV